MMISLALFLLFAGLQEELRNRDFEGDAVGAAPLAWELPQRCADGGYALEVADRSPAGGERCAVLSGVAGGSAESGNCYQVVDAAPYRGKRVRYSAAVRCEPADERSQARLWLRVDCRERGAGFFDNMYARPIRAPEWRRYEIVGDVAEDARRLVLGLFLDAGGAALLDDVALEVVGTEVATTVKQGLDTAPGLARVAYGAKGRVLGNGTSARFRFPLPLAYRDQTPLTFRLALEPAGIHARAALVEGPGPNRVLELELVDLAKGAELVLSYESAVLVSPTSFEGVPERAAFPDEWPAEAAPWLAATWCCDSADERMRALGSELRAAGDVRAALDGALRRSQEIIERAEGQGNDATALEALERKGACTGNANLLAALLRAAGVPARVLAGYPTWSGPLQTHFIVEAFLPGWGWYPLESTLGKAPWPNFQQVAVSLVPVEHESKALAGARLGAGGGVPYMAVTEHAYGSPLILLGTLKENWCDHEARLLRPIDAADGEWTAALEWARVRWDAWLRSAPAIHDGRLEFGPPAESLAARTLAELRAELR